LALAAHTGFGLYAVLVKRLLCCLPPFRLLAVAFGLAVPVTFWLVRRHFRWQDFWLGTIWLLTGITVLRSIFKLLALQFTLATYVQLIDLTVPFFAPIAAWLWLQEAIPPRTFTALTLASVGSFLVITVNPFAIRLLNGVNDLVGMVFALASALAMALGVVCTRYLTHRRNVDSGTLFLQHMVGLALTYILLTLVAGETWLPFTVLTAADWAFYALLVLVAIVGGGLSQVMAISRGKAALFSTLLSWRLVVTLGAGWILLGERLHSVWQVLGVVIVVGAITWYLQSAATRRNTHGSNSA